MDELNGGELQDGQGMPFEHQCLAAAISVLGAISGVWWHAPFLTLKVLSSFMPSPGIVRLPPYIIPSRNLMLVRRLIKALFNCSQIYVDAVSQASLAQLFANTTEALLMDLTAAADGTAPFIKRYAYVRSIPGNSIAIKISNEIVPIEIYGESLFILSDLMPACISPTGVILDLVPNPAAVHIIDDAALEGLKDDLGMFAEGLTSDMAGVTLPDQRFVEESVTQGFLFLISLARQADAFYPSGRFEAAVQEAWVETGLRARAALPPAKRRGMLCSHLLEYLDDEENRPEGPGAGYREDVLANYIRSSDPEMFAEFDQTALGKELFRLGIGTSGRHAYPGESPGPSRVWRTYVIFSAADKIKLRAEASDESQS